MQSLPNDRQAQTKGKGTPSPLPTITKPFLRTAMDLVGPLPKSSEGHRWLLAITDYGSRYTEEIPLQSTKSPVIADEVAKFVLSYGIPDESWQIKELSSCLKKKIVLSTEYKAK
ncbi:hypothetical protein QYM36_007024 [Artemia franciscana]|uniref:Uncharacterized protein n=1 Tax=Artemia franciscana TaxID=6661 RepID=A0AA88HUY7_ARTSF|nr:hypothetical protein QYM36_007024 [Artemia franciscana]